MLDDQPSATDLLGFGPYAQALEDLLLAPDAKTPFIIGVFGRWGSGKTTLLQQLKARVDVRGATSVWFGAWLYGQEKEIWAALLNSVSRQLFERLRPWDRVRFAAEIYRRGLAWERLVIALPRLAARLLLVLTPVAAAALASVAIPSLHDAATALGLAGVAASGLVAWQAVRPSLEKASGSLLPGIALSRTMDFEDHLGVLERFREQFGRMVQALPSPRQRLVIFVDDLDRCEPAKALQLLDAIKVFLDLPGCMFVLGLDIAVVQRAIDSKYEGDPLARREYLGKIIQLAFHLPTPTPSHLREYLAKLSVTFPDARCGEVFLASLAANPRELKRVVNSYGFSWRLAQTQGLGEITPVRLAKVVVIQQAYDRLFAMLRERPDWLPLLERAFRQQAGLEPPAPPMSDDPGATVIMGPAGISVPPALEALLSEEPLERLLTLHATPGNFGDEDFGALSRDEVGVYFNFAAREGRGFGHSEAPTVIMTPVAPEFTAPSGVAPPAAPPPQAAAVRSGDLPSFGPRYAVLSRIGSGGISEVFLADDLSLKRKVAIKRLHATLAGDPRWMQRFRREIALLTRVTQHPNIVSVFDSGEAPDEAGRPAMFYVMEAIVGRTLEELLTRGPLAPKEQRAYLAPLFDGLAHVHANGIVHGDIKPASILISPTGEAKLIDFGLAFQAEDGRDNLTSTGTVLGTLAYASPEQLRAEAIGPSSDLYSLGAVIYEAISGRKPFGSDVSGMAERFNGPPPRMLAPPVDGPDAARLDHLERVVMTLMQPAPQDRYASAELAKADFLAAFTTPGPA